MQRRRFSKRWLYGLGFLPLLAFVMLLVSSSPSEQLPINVQSYGLLLCKGKSVGEYRVQFLTYPVSPATGEEVEIVTSVEYLNGTPAKDVKTTFVIYKGLKQLEVFEPRSSPTGIFKFTYSFPEPGKYPLVFLIMKGVNITSTTFSIDVRDELGKTFLSLAAMIVFPSVVIALTVVVIAVVRKYDIL